MAEGDLVHTQGKTHTHTQGTTDQVVAEGDLVHTHTHTQGKTDQVVAEGGDEEREALHVRERGQDAAHQPKSVNRLEKREGDGERDGERARESERDGEREREREREGERERQRDRRQRVRESVAGCTVGTPNRPATTDPHKASTRRGPQAPAQLRTT